MLRPHKTISPDHEALFIERYERLCSWSLRLTENDQELAEDLLHDAFVQFTLTPPDLQAIHHLDSYLYSMLRNLHISQVRRTTRNRFQQLSIVDYESAEAGLRTIDPRAQIQVQDELRRVCQYACARKQTSKGGSVLILRFFHGYYPSEIALILGGTRLAVDSQLNRTRSEAKLHLDNPERLRQIRETSIPAVVPTGFARTPEGFLDELRQTIFNSRQGECFSKSQFKDVYRTASHSHEVRTGSGSDRVNQRNTQYGTRSNSDRVNQGNTQYGTGSGSERVSSGDRVNQHNTHERIDCERLAHLVSCASCLDQVNKLLGVPLLSDRYPTDTIGNDPSSRGGSGGGSSTGGSMSRSLRRWKRGARETFEHKPQELCISVNGYLQGSQKISSEVMEQSLTVDMVEDISFVEIFSEQGIRLLLLNVDEMPPEGPGQRRLRAELSDARALELTLTFNSPWPTLHVLYHDPAINELQNLGFEFGVEQVQGLMSNVQRPEAEVLGPTSNVQSPEIQIEDSTSRLESWTSKGRTRKLLRALSVSVVNLFKDLGHWTLDFGLLLRPGAVTALLALLLIAASLFVKLRNPIPAISAHDLLQRSAEAEEAVAGRSDTVIHRTINLEERKVPSGDLLALRTIEVWQSAERGLTARRVYDEKRNLLAGQWRRADGVETLYHHGARPQLRLQSESKADPLSSSEAMWQLELSAQGFTELVGMLDTSRVEEQPTVYVVNYANEASTADGLIRASLTLSRGDLHPIEQTLLVRRGGEQREHTFVETVYERRAPKAVAPAVFEPEAELLGDAETRGHGDTEKKSPLPRLSVPASAPLATAELEVEVLSLLSKAGADLGEQVSATRTPAGQLKVEGIVETNKRKTELLSVLGPLKENPTVILEIRTVAEALARQNSTRPQTGTVAIEQAQSASNIVPIDAELRRFFSRRGFSGAQLDDAVRGFSSRMLSRSLNTMLHAWALKRLAQRFSPEDLRTLAPEAKAKWQGMIREHAAALHRETALLDQELQPLGRDVATEAERGPGITDDASLVRAIEKLFELTFANDETIRLAFAVSTSNSTAEAIKTPRFWRSLRGARQIAANIQQSMTSGK